MVGIGVVTRGFTTDPLGPLWPGLFGTPGCLLIALWGLAYAAVAARWAQVPELCAVFALEKLFYGGFLGAVLDRCEHARPSPGTSRTHRTPRCSTWCTEPAISPSAACSRGRRGGACSLEPEQTGPVAVEHRPSRALGDLDAARTRVEVEQAGAHGIHRVPAGVPEPRGGPRFPGEGEQPGVVVALDAVQPVEHIGSEHDLVGVRRHQPPEVASRGQESRLREVHGQTGVQDRNQAVGIGLEEAEVRDDDAPTGFEGQRSLRPVRKVHQHVRGPLVAANVAAAGLGAPGPRDGVGQPGALAIHDDPADHLAVRVQLEGEPHAGLVEASEVGAGAAEPRQPVEPADPQGRIDPRSVVGLAGVVLEADGSACDPCICICEALRGEPVAAGWRGARAVQAGQEQHVGGLRGFGDRLVVLDHVGDRVGQRIPEGHRDAVVRQAGDHGGDLAVPGPLQRADVARRGLHGAVGVEVEDRPACVQRDRSAARCPQPRPHRHLRGFDPRGQRSSKVS